MYGKCTDQAKKKKKNKSMINTYAKWNFFFFFGINQKRNTVKRETRRKQISRHNVSQFKLVFVTRIIAIYVFLRLRLIYMLQIKLCIWAKQKRIASRFWNVKCVALSNNNDGDQLYLTDFKNDANVEFVCETTPFFFCTNIHTHTDVPSFMIMDKVG